MLGRSLQDAWPSTGGNSRAFPGLPDCSGLPPASLMWGLPHTCPLAHLPSCTHTLVLLCPLLARCYPAQCLSRDSWVRDRPTLPSPPPPPGAQTCRLHSLSSPACVPATCSSPSPGPWTLPQAGVASQRTFQRKVPRSRPRPFPAWLFSSASLQAVRVPGPRQRGRLGLLALIKPQVSGGSPCWGCGEAERVSRGGHGPCHPDPTRGTGAGPRPWAPSSAPCLSPRLGCPRPVC